MKCFPKHSNGMTGSGKMTKLMIQIPCLNEEKYLPGTYTDLPKQIAGIDEIETLVIDDGSSDRTAEVVQAVMAYQYTTGRGGLPGNDDSGGLSSWYVWSAMGLFPVAGQDLYLIGSPVFDACELDVGGGFSVDVDSRSEREIYVQEAWLDDTPIDRAYLRHHELVDCRRLRLRMGPEPSTWATAERPPSHSGPETDA